MGESRTRGAATIPLGLKPSQDSRAPYQRDSSIWIQPLGVFRYNIPFGIESWWLGTNHQAIKLGYRDGISMFLKCNQVKSGHYRWDILIAIDATNHAPAVDVLRFQVQHALTGTAFFVVFACRKCNWGWDQESWSGFCFLRLGQWPSLMRLSDWTMSSQPALGTTCSSWAVARGENITCGLTNCFV